MDLKTNNLVYPNFMNVTNTSLNTTIENEYGVKVSTIEHLMGALFGLGIDNALIEIDNEEVPILDGSAKIFIEKIISAGLQISDKPIKIIKINNEIMYSEGEVYINKTFYTYFGHWFWIKIFQPNNWKSKKCC